MLPIRRTIIAAHTVDKSGLSQDLFCGVACAEPPKAVPSTVFNGGKGTSVSGRCLGPIVSGVVAGELCPRRGRPADDEKR